MVETKSFDVNVERQHTGSLKYDKYAFNRDDSSMWYRPNTIPMWVADMDFPSPPAVIKAISERAHHNIFGYTVPTWKNKATVLRYLQNKHHVSVNPKDLVFLPGLVVALNLISRLAAKQNLSIMTAAPIYPPFMSAPTISGTNRNIAHLQKCKSKNRWTFDFDQMHKMIREQEQATARRIGWFFLCNPHNPTGRVYTRPELEELAEFCERYDINVCADEIHCDLILDETCKHIPFSHVKNSGLITLHAPSKTYNLAGLATAFAVITEDKLRVDFKREMRGICADSNIFGLTAMCAAYDEGESWRLNLIEYLRGNLRLIEDTLAPFGVLEHKHEATYLAWLNADKLYSMHQEKQVQLQSNPKQNFADRILLDFDLGFNSGEDFGPSPKDYRKYVRLNFGCPRPVLSEALSRLVPFDK